MTRLGIDSGLGTRDSTWLDLGLRPAQLARLGAWDRALTRFGLEARPGSKLRARPGSGLGARLGSEPGSAHLGSENITRCPPAVRSWRRAKIVRNLCEIYHFAPLCLVLTIEEQSSNCISVPNFASLAFPEVKERCLLPMYIGST